MGELAELLAADREVLARWGDESEVVEADDGIPRRMRISAEYTLTEWRSGTLTHDW